MTTSRTMEGPGNSAGMRLTIQGTSKVLGKVDIVAASRNVPTITWANVLEGPAGVGGRSRLSSGGAMNQWHGGW